MVATVNSSGPTDQKKAQEGAASLPPILHVAAELILGDGLADGILRLPDVSRPALDDS